MGTAHALVIDDDATGLDVLAEFLATMGMTCTKVQIPARAEQVLASLDRVDIVFLDLEMPHIDGYEMLDILRNRVGISAPIVAYSVHVSEIRAAQQLGFDSFIGKPMDLDRFPAQLRRILRGEQVWETGQ
jgi:two-component system cell cycle response regulator DivK